MRFVLTLFSISALFLTLSVELAQAEYCEPVVKLSREEEAKVVAKERELFGSLMMPILESVKELVAKRDKTRPPIIAIGGCSSVGKSKFTNRLASVLRDKNMRIAILALDDFQQVAPVTTSPANSLLHKYFDHQRLHEVLRQIESGRTQVQKPVWEHRTWAHKTKEEVIASFDSDLILLEGTYALCDEETYDLLKYSDFRIFIDAPEQVIVEWNWEREMAGGHPRSREQFETEVGWDMEDYKKVILPTKRFADVVITKDANHNYHFTVLNTLSSVRQL